MAPTSLLGAPGSDNACIMRSAWNACNAQPHICQEQLASKPAGTLSTRSLTHVLHLCADVAYASPDFQVNVQYADGTSSTSYNLYGLDTVNAPCFWNQVRQLQGTQQALVSPPTWARQVRPKLQCTCLTAAAWQAL